VRVCLKRSFYEVVVTGYGGGGGGGGIVLGLSRGFGAVQEQGIEFRLFVFRVEWRRIEFGRQHRQFEWPRLLDRNRDVYL
jgi:hypothetical protein